MNFKRYLIVILTTFTLVLTGCTVDEPASDKKILGASARDFLSDENYTSLKVEIVYVNGYNPTQSTLTVLENFLKKYLNKPAGIIFSERAIPSPEKGILSISEVREIEKQNRTVFNTDKQLTAFIYFADNISEASLELENSDERILGKAYSSSSIVIFEKDVQDMAASSSNVTKTEIEHTILRHEFGHLFGLVNNGSPAQSPHEDTDPAYKAHCNVADCLMAGSIDFASAVNQIENEEQILDFDEKCRLDLVANGGK
ncbi:hypothetical protein [Salinimicrobium flavum]|uniref:Membrane metalloprotease n=1 Tax=Salinimicrobium flavum TaxID=1737065 RepID=A0ABW5IUN4_9FLAO